MCTSVMGMSVGDESGVDETEVEDLEGVEPVPVRGEPEPQLQVRAAALPYAGDDLPQNELQFLKKSLEKRG